MTNGTLKAKDWIGLIGSMVAALAFLWGVYDSRASAIEQILSDHEVRLTKSEALQFTSAEAKELSNQVTRLNVELIAQQRTVEKVGNSIDALRLEINREPDSLRKQIEQLSDQIDELQKGLRNG
ncbi:MAG: hypothetical protein ACYTFG_18775 [Planctomycetota bacterium]|jgi:septal ring factor EnvC (AmiA/AmiB activator)